MDNYLSAPPHYPTDLPAYTPDAGPDERLSSIAGPNTSVPSQDYEYKNGNLRLNLGQKRHGLFRPAYGWNASVEGFVQVKKKMTNVQSIVVSVEGNVKTGVSERGFLTDLTKSRVLHMSQTLFDASSGESLPVGGARYRFSFPLPSYVSGGTQPLPPTFSALHPGVGADVTYFVKVEMVRKGILRQNERLKAFFFYLPRTYAPSTHVPAEVEKPDNGCEWHVTSVLPTLPHGGAPNPASSLCVSVAFRKPLEYAAGSAIPFYLTVASGSTSGVLPLLFSGLSVQLVRITTVKVNDRQSSSEKVMGGGEVFRIEERGDVRTMFGSVQCSKRGESSWAVAGIGVKHIVRVRLGPPRDVPSLTCTLPTYAHEQAVTLRTHERSWSMDDEREPELAQAPRARSVL